MADTTHLDKLLQGKKIWNDWRLAYPAVQPDLSGVDFASFRFSHAGELRTDFDDWQSINLAGVNLQKTTLILKRQI